MKGRRPLKEMGKEGEKQPEISGKPADVCPYCGAAMFKYRTSGGERETVRYVKCRNERCQKRFISYQPPEKLLREVNPDSSDGIEALTIPLRIA